jgi:phage N-6-adenine-methyltransferase
MTLVGFKARNHPQQSAARGPRPEIDERGTPWEMFNPLHERYGFTIDVAALPRNAKCERFYTPEDDGLEQSWDKERVWCNPPYSNIEPWVSKAHLEWFSGRVELIVMLVPANRTEQGWWQRQVEPFRDLNGGLRVKFLPGRPRFIAFDGDRVEPNQRPPFGCALLIWGAG